MFSRFVTLILALGLVFVACSSDDNPTAPAPAQSVADYIWFDTTSIIRDYSSAAIDDGGHWYYVDGDSIIGEPFIDVNGNGIYDAVIDTFVVSGDPATNMDINHNGSYDGPTDPYYVGEPYEDYNQNGVYDAPNQSYDVGEPFFDRNGNGIMDNAPGGVVYGKWHYDSTGATYRWHYSDSVTAWTSPLGERYVMPPSDAWWIWDYNTNENQAHPYVNFHVGSDGLQYRDYGDWRVPLADTGSPVTGQSTVVVAKGPDTSGSWYYIGRRTIQLNQSLEIDSTLYENLLRIRIDNLTDTTGQLIDYMYWEFYFSKDAGLLAGSWDAGFGRGGYFQRYGTYDSLPRPMIRDTITPQP